MTARILTLDIETAPHKVFAWGLYAQDIHFDNIVEPGYTLCFAARWLGEKKMLFHSVWDDGAKGMVKAAHALLHDADAVIHFNGQKFDIPVLNSEFLARYMKPPAPYHQIDLYRTAKQRFRLPSNSMDYVARVLGIEGKVKHKGMDLWRGVMAGNAQDQAVMKKYNIHDVEMAEQIYEAMLPWIKNHPNLALWTDDTRPRCTNCGGARVVRQGERKTKTQVYQRFQCRDCGTWLRGRNTTVDKEKRKSVLTEAG